LKEYFVHVLRAVRGCFALKEYFVHVFRAVCGYFALAEYFVHVLRTVRGYFALEEGIGLCWEDELHMFLKIIILQQTLK
jgi:hypothetical protein